PLSAMRATRDCRIWRAKCYRCWRHRLSSWRRRLRRSRSKSIPTQLAKPGVSSGHRSRLNDEDSVRGPHQGQQSTRTAATGRTHDCKRPLRCTPNDLLLSGGHPHMRRREFITLLGGAAAASPLEARAKQAERRRRVGVLMCSPEGDPQAQANVTALLGGLQNLGWIEGRNVQIDYRWAGGDPDKARTFARELIAMMPDVMVPSTNQVTRI